MTEVRVVVNGRVERARRRAAAAARAPAPRRARAHRHALGLRHVQLRGLRGVARRRAGEVLHRARRDGRRPRRAHGGGAGPAGRPRPGAARVHRLPRPAVRVLHPGDAAHGPVAARPHARPDRGGDPHGHRGHHLPLHGLREHRQGDPAGGRHDRHAHRSGLTHTARSVREPATVCVESHELRSGAPEGGRPVRARPRPVRRRHRAARHAARRRAAQPARPRPDRRRRHTGRRVAPARARRASPASSSPSAASPGCPRSRTTCRRCSPPTRCATRGRRWRSSSRRPATPPATRSR